MKKILPVIMLACMAMVVTSCNKQRSAVNKVVDVNLAPNQTYSYTIAPGGNAKEQMQMAVEPQHALLVNLAAGPDGSTILTYTPAENFIGSDMIQVKGSPPHHKGLTPPPPPHPGGGNCQGGRKPGDDITYIFRINIQGHKPNE